MLALDALGYIVVVGKLGSEEGRFEKGKSLHCTVELCDDTRLKKTLELKLS